MWSILLPVFPSGDVQIYLWMLGYGNIVRTFNSEIHNSTSIIITNFVIFSFAIVGLKIPCLLLLQIQIDFQSIFLFAEECTKNKISLGSVCIFVPLLRTRERLWGTPWNWVYTLYHLWSSKQRNSKSLPTVTPKMQTLKLLKYWEYLWNSWIDRHENWYICRATWIDLNGLFDYMITLYWSRFFMPCYSYI
jgi:hypothetical protein